VARDRGPLPPIAIGAAGRAEPAVLAERADQAEPEDQAEPAGRVRVPIAAPGRQAAEPDVRLWRGRIGTTAPGRRVLRRRRAADGRAATGSEMVRRSAEPLAGAMPVTAAAPDSVAV
jgi:hypothetical protein